MLRRLPLSRLLLLCGLAVAIGVSATALAFALGTGPTPPPKPLAQALHDALAAPAVQGVSAEVTLTNRLLEGASLAGGEHQGLTSDPLVNGGTGRLWISSDGRVRLELQSEQGDTQVTWDGHTLQVYDAATNTAYRYTPPARAGAAREAGAADRTQGHAGPPSLSAIEAAIARIRRHATLSEAQATDVAGQPAYTVRLGPDESGSLLAGAELSFDADNGAPLRAAVYSTESPAPVIELAATSISFGPVSSSVFEITPPPSAKIEEISTTATGSGGSHAGGGQHPQVTAHGHGISAIAVLEAKAHGKSHSSELEGLPKVSVGGGATATELRTELGTILTFERGGISYLLAGAVPAGPVEALARGL